MTDDLQAARERLKAWITSWAYTPSPVTSAASIVLSALDRMEARALAADGMWRPIESAPKDGTPILAWCVHPNARWAGDDKDWAAPVVTQWITHNGGGWTWNGMAGSFTHWMPLPDPPRAAALAREEGEGKAG